MKVTAISGSLHESSGNTALVRAVAERAPAGTEVRVWDRLLDVPAFTPDIADDDIAEVVRDLDAALVEADLIVIATPEYGGGMPGVLKNACDWMVGLSGFDGKRVLVTSAAPNEARGANARRWVEETTRMQGATIVDSFSVAVRNGVGLDDAVTRVLDRIGAAALPAEWDEAATTYETKLEPTTGFVLDRYLEYVAPAPGAVVADVGCGPGVVALACAQAGARVKALDLSPAMVDRLRVRADERGIGELVEGVVGDAEKLPFADDECDAAVSNFGVIFCPDITAALRELARVTRPGGPLMISAWTVEERNGWTTLLPAEYAQTLGFAVRPRPMYRWRSSEELAAACADAGWTDVSIETVSAESTVLKSAADVADLFLTPPSRAALRDLSDTQVHALLEFIKARATEQFGDGEVALPREAWLARGRA